MTISAQQLALSSDLEGTGTGSRDLQIATALSKTFSGASISIPASELQVTGTPSGANDAVNKSYVDGLSAGLDPKESCRVATTEALPDSPTYDNGASGVGATLTGAGNTALGNIDGILVGPGNRILVKDQAAALQNGIYDVTNGGTNAIAAEGTVTFTNNLANGDTLTIDAKTYTFQNTLTNVDGNIQIGASSTDTRANLIAAINLTGTPGTDYAAAMTLHPTVSASQPGANPVITAKTAGAAGNSIAFTETAGFLTLDGGGTLGGTTTGVDGVAYVLTRSTDFDGSPANEVSGGAFTFVEQGTQGGNGYNVIFDGNITVGTDSIDWSQFSATGGLTGGDGIDITGTTVSAVVADFAGSGLEDDGGNNLRIAAAAAGDGLTGGGGSALAVQANGSTIDVAAGGISVADGQIDTTQLADNGVTPAKNSYVWAIATAAASAFSFDGTRSNVTLANAALNDLELNPGYICLRNGVDELTKKSTTTSAGDWSVGGTTWSIHGDITASGDTYRLRFMQANT